MPVTVRLPDELADQVDELRSDVPRERWVRRAVEERLARERSRIIGNGQVGTAEKARRPSPAEATTPAAVTRPTSSPVRDSTGSGCLHPRARRTPWGKCRDCGEQAGQL